MASRILNTSFDCADPWALAQFWSAALGLPVHPEDTPEGEEIGIPMPDGDLIFQHVPEAKVVKNRLHLCLEPDGPRDAEVLRLLGIGASLLNDLRKPDGTGWAVLADPEGNEFCVLRSASERAATSSST